MGNFLQRQGQYILQKDMYAFLLAAILPCIPFAAWLSLVVMSLVTLSRGGHSGFKVLIVGVVASIIFSNLTAAIPYATGTIIVTWGSCFFSAWLLRTSASWQIVAIGLLLAVLSVVVLIQCLVPGYITEELHFLLSVLSSLKQGEFIAGILDKLDPASLALFAHYLLGIKSLCIVLSVVSSLILARYVQSLLVYPEGFRKELLLFRANRLVVLFLVIAMAGAYQGNAVAISCLPLLVSFLTTAGICLGFNILGKRKNNMLALLVLFVPLIVLPYIMIPAYMVFGCLDSLFDFRMRLLAKAGELRE